MFKHLQPTGPFEPLVYKTHKIHMVTFADSPTPWFVADDIAAAIGLRPQVAANCIVSPQFPAHACRMCPRVSKDDSPERAVLSPVGVYWLGAMTDEYRGQGIAAFARREGLRLNPDAPRSDPLMYLTLNEDGTLPPRPLKFHGRKDEFFDLKHLSISILAKRRREQQAAMLEAAERGRLEDDANA